MTCQMREAQREYIDTRDQRALRRARALENEVDREIARVKAIIAQTEQDITAA